MTSSSSRSSQGRSEPVSEEIKRKCLKYEKAHQEFLESFFGETVIKVLLNKYPPSSNALSIHDFLYILEGYSVPEHHFDKRHEEASLRTCVNPIIRKKSDSLGDSIDSAYYETMSKLGVSYDDFEGPLSPGRSGPSSTPVDVWNEITPTATRLLKGTTRQPVIAKRNANIDMMISAANLNASKPTNAPASSHAVICTSTFSPTSPVPTPASAFLSSPKAASLLSPKASTISASTNHFHTTIKSSKNGIDKGNNNNNIVINSYKSSTRRNKNSNNSYKSSNNSSYLEQPVQSPVSEEQQNSNESVSSNKECINSVHCESMANSLINSSSSSPAVACSTGSRLGNDSRSISECISSPRKVQHGEGSSSSLSSCPPIAEIQPVVVTAAIAAATKGATHEQAMNNTNNSFSKSSSHTDLSTRSRSSSRSSSVLSNRGLLSSQDTRRRHIDELLLLRKVVIDSF